MYGTNINSLVAEVSTNGGSSWAQIFTKSGDQGNQWFTETVDLSAFQSSNVSFRFTVTTGSGNQGWRSDIALDNIRIASGSGSGSGGGPAPTGYCAAAGSTTSDEWIQRAVIGTIDNNSGANGGYADFTSQQTDALIGGSLDVSFTVGWSGTVYNEAFAIYLDLNRDGDFNDAGELIGSSTPGTTNPVAGSLSIPATAQAGLTRLRVIMQYNATPSDPCASFQFGEIEDYTVNLVSGPTAVGVNNNPTPLVINNTYNPEGVREVSASAFPNPASKYTTVKVKAGIGTKVKMLMMDVNGIGMKSVDRISETGVVEERFNTSKLKSGLYLIQVWTVDGIKMLKVIKE